MAKCRECGETSVQQIEVNGECLEVCHLCGTSHSDIANQLTSYKETTDEQLLFKKKLPHSRFSRFQTLQLPRQLHGHVEKPKSSSRKEFEHSLTLGLDKLRLTQSGSVAQEAKNLLDSSRLVGTNFNKDCFAAACIFVALRNHSRDVKLKNITKSLDVDLAKTNQAFKYFKKAGGTRVVQGPKLDENLSVSEILKCGKFLAPNGDEEDHSVMIDKVERVVQLLKLLPTRVSISRELVYGVAYYLYKCERRSNNMTFERFAKECSLPQIEDKKQVKKIQIGLTRHLKLLISKLPFVDLSEKELRNMKMDGVLSYLPDILKYNDTISTSFIINTYKLSKPNSALTKKVCEQEENSDLDYSDEETSCYLRTEQEVAILKPIFETLYETKEKK